MALRTQISELSWTDLDLSLRQPFGISRGSQDRAGNLLVRVELAGGTVGYGEAAPFPAFNGETREQARAALAGARVHLLGSNVRHWRRLARNLREWLPCAAARCAVETAVVDAFTRYQKVSLWRYFGGGKRQLRTDITLTTGTAEAARIAAADAVLKGFRTLKIKVGGGEPGTDIERLQAVHEVAPVAGLILDANAAFTSDQALELIAGLRGLGIKPLLFEQPVAREDLDGMARVRREGRVLVAADESACSSADVRAIAKAGAAQVINIKLMKSGLAEAMDMAWLARESGLRLMIGGLVESRLAMGMSACFAAGTGGFSYVDLDTPLFLKSEPLAGGIVYEGDVIKVAHIKEGHGVVPA